jgi:hypothetical protein
MQLHRRPLSDRWNRLTASGFFSLKGTPCSLDGEFGWKQRRETRTYSTEFGWDWTPGPKDIYFTDGHDSFADLFAYKFEDQRIRNIGRLSQTLSLGTPSLALSPDGKWILYAVIDHTKSDIRLRRDTSYELKADLGAAVEFVAFTPRSAINR